VKLKGTAFLGEDLRLRLLPLTGTVKVIVFLGKICFAKSLRVSKDKGP
jgi:hypothetical protein